MNIKMLDENKVEVTHILDLEKVIKDWDDHFVDDYHTKNELIREIAVYFVEKHGESMVSQLKEKLMGEWAETFKSEVLQKALQQVMNKKDY